MAVQKYAVLDGTTVVNLILLDASSDYTPPEDHLIVPAPDVVAIGWNWAANEWIPTEEYIQETEIPTEPIEDVTATNEAVQELIDAGISQKAAHRILGLPFEDDQ